jgi:isopenicillin-N epimerase
MVEITGLEPSVADDPRWFAQMATLPLPAGTNTTAIKRRLYDEYRVEIPANQWGGRPSLRISVQGYNTRTDIERLLEAAASLLL